MQQQNLKVREKNLQKFRQDTFKPKVPWGIDERKINGVTEYEVRKNADEIRNRRRMERQRARSAGRGVIGLDGLDKLKEEFNIPVKKALHIHPPPVHPKKQQKKHDPKLKTFMKKKKKERK